jgi:phosphatidylglycerophosphate synthase
VFSTLWTRDVGPAMGFLEKIAASRRTAQPADEGWRCRPYRTVSIFISLPLARLGIIPNHITITWGLIGFLGAIALACPQYWLRVTGACLLQVSALLDYVDGEVARLTGRVSNVGLFLDLTNHEVIRNSLFLALGYSVVRSTNNLVYFVLAFSAAVFVSAYQTSFFFAERVAPGGVIKDYASKSLVRRASFVRNAVTPLFLSMNETKPVILLAAIFNRLSWVLTYYAIIAPLLYLWRVCRLSSRLRQD